MSNSLNVIKKNFKKENEKLRYSEKEYKFINELFLDYYQNSIDHKVKSLVVPAEWEMPSKIKYISELIELNV